MTDDIDKDIALNALALIASVSRGDEESFNKLLSVYSGPDKDNERGHLLMALIGHTVSFLNLASRALDREPCTILGGVRASLDGLPETAPVKDDDMPGQYL